MDDVVRFGKCVSDPVDLRILSVLRVGELCSCEIEGSTGLGRRTVQDRMRKLQHAGLVRIRQRERWLAFGLDPRFSDLLETLFEAFDEDLAFDENLIRDRRALTRLLRERVDGWCVDPKR